MIHLKIPARFLSQIQRKEKKKLNMEEEKRKLSIVMYPWFAMGHLTTFLHLSNKLAERGHKISFFLPTKTQPKLHQFNLHPDLIDFVPLDVPDVEGLPAGAETTADVPPHLQHLLRLAMDRTRPTIESLLKQIEPNVVFYDFTHWLPELTRELGIKCLAFVGISPAMVAYSFREEKTTDAELMEPPAGFPPSCLKLRTHEARGLNFFSSLIEPGSGISFLRRILIATKEADAIGFKSCKEIEGPYCDFIAKKFGKPVILAGPVVPEPPTSKLDEQWENWLNGFKPKTVIFCAFGSECRTEKNQFQELLLGLEMTGLPFFAALKPPVGADTIESALPDGFRERTQKRGIVHGGWVQQQLILSHPAVGCFVTHCGSGSLLEVLVNGAQIVLLPQFGDQFINARLMGNELRVGVEVEKRDEDGLFTRKGVSEAVASVMDEESEIGKEVRGNHAKWREFLTRKGLESCYIDGFIDGLRALISNAS